MVKKGSFNNVPQPGTQKAELAGCTCSVLDNRFGRGAAEDLRTGQPIWWIQEGCPLHDPPPPAVSEPAAAR